MFKLVAIVGVTILSLINLGCSVGHRESITQEELVRRTQELLDGVSAGDQKPFERYFADDGMDHDEKGRSMDKRALLADITPPPPDWSGSINLVHPQSLIFADLAIMSYDVAETEVISGQTMHARYHTTDTWLQRKGVWQIIAEQALRYYEDPAVGVSDATKYDDYLGVYRLTPDKAIQVSRAGEALFSQRSGKEKELLLPEAGDIFFRKGVEGRQLFRRDAQGKVDALVDRRNNEDIVWLKAQ